MNHKDLSTLIRSVLVCAMLLSSISILLGLRSPAKADFIPEPNPPGNNNRVEVIQNDNQTNQSPQSNTGGDNRGGRSDANGGNGYWWQRWQILIEVRIALRSSGPLDHVVQFILLLECSIWIRKYTPICLTLVTLVAVMPVSMSPLWPHLNSSTIWEWLRQHPNETITTENPPMESYLFDSRDSLW